MLVKIGKYIGFCVYRRSYLLWPPEVVVAVVAVAGGVPTEQERANHEHLSSMHIPLVSYKQRARFSQVLLEWSTTPSPYTGTGCIQF